MVRIWGKVGSHAIAKTTLSWRSLTRAIGSFWFSCPDHPQSRGEVSGDLNSTNS